MGHTDLAHGIIHCGIFGYFLSKVEYTFLLLLFIGMTVPITNTTPLCLGLNIFVDFTCGSTAQFGTKDIWLNLPQNITCIIVTPTNPVTQWAHINFHWENCVPMNKEMAPPGTCHLNPWPSMGIIQLSPMISWLCFTKDISSKAPGSIHWFGLFY